jgi:plastocyanin
MHARRTLAPMILVVALAAACGDDPEDSTDAQNPLLPRSSPDGGEGGGSGATIVAEDIAFDRTEITASAGETLVITFDNRDDGVPHNLHVTGAAVDEKTEIADGPTTQSLEVTLAEPGEYGFVCDVHPAEMTGTITVE